MVRGGATATVGVTFVPTDHRHQDVFGKLDHGALLAVRIRVGAVPKIREGLRTEFCFVEDRDYVRITPQDSLRPSPHGAIDYYGTLSMGKELAMVENNRDVARRLGADEKDTIDIIDSMGRRQRVTVVNEAGLTSWADLERVGVLLFVPEARHGGSPSNETGNSLPPAIG
jgi:hypothetical protein